MKSNYDGKSKELINNALQELYKSFAMLPKEEQKFAEIFINDVQLGNIVPEADKTFRDYVTEYMCHDKQDKIHRFAVTFGVDEEKLRKIMSLEVTEENLNEFGRYGKLADNADKEKIVSYYKGIHKYKDSEEFLIVCDFKNLLKKFILSGGFEL